MKQPLVKRIFPFLNWWPRVNSSSLRHDFIAGITGAIIVLPQGVAFAIIAGLPPIYGLYTAMVTPIIAALYGSSWHLISGPTTAISIVVFSSISQFADPGTTEFIKLALVLTFMAGIAQFALGIARLGTLVNFVSHSVVIGFTAGAAVLIATSQLRHFFGLEIEKGVSFYETWINILGKLPATNIYFVIVAGSTLLIALLIRRLLPKWPYMLISMVLGSVINILISGTDHGVTVVGEMPAHLPPFAIPDLNFSNFTMLAPNAFAIALLGLIEAVAIARSIAIRSQQRINGNQEFVGQGLSNIVGSFFSSYAGSGSFTRSGVNFAAGARTPIAAIFAAIILMIAILFIAPLAAYLPIPAMAGIIILVAYNLIDFDHIRKILKASWAESAVLTITFFTTLFLQLEFAIYFGVFFSLVFYLQRTSRPLIVTMAPDPDHPKRKFTNLQMKALYECPQLKIIRIDGSLFFGAVDHVITEIRNIQERTGIRHFLIIANGFNLIDVAGAEMLVMESRLLKEKGGGLYLSGMKKRAREFMQKGGYWDEIGGDNFFPTKDAAIVNIFSRLEQDVCRTCQYRIFHECESITE